MEYFLSDEETKYKCCLCVCVSAFWIFGRSAFEWRMSVFWRAFRVTPHSLITSLLNFARSAVLVSFSITHPFTISSFAWCRRWCRHDLNGGLGPIKGTRKQANQTRFTFTSLMNRSLAYDNQWCAWESHAQYYSTHGFTEGRWYQRWIIEYAGWLWWVSFWSRIRFAKVEGLGEPNVHLFVPSLTSGTSQEKLVPRHFSLVY